MRYIMTVIRTGWGLKKDKPNKDGIIIGREVTKDIELGRYEYEENRTCKKCDIRKECKNFKGMKRGNCKLITALPFKDEGVYYTIKALPPVND